MRVIPNFIGLNKTYSQTQFTWTGIEYLDKRLFNLLSLNMKEYITELSRKCAHYKSESNDVETKIYINTFPKFKGNKIGYVRLSDFSLGKKFVHDFTKSISPYIDTTGIRSKLVLYNLYTFGENINDDRRYNLSTFETRGGGFVHIGAPSYYISNRIRLSTLLSVPSILPHESMNNLRNSYESVYTTLSTYLIENNLLYKDVKYNILFTPIKHKYINEFDAFSKIFEFIYTLLDELENVNLSDEDIKFISEIETYVNYIRTNGCIYDFKYDRFNNIFKKIRLFGSILYLTDDVRYAPVLNIINKIVTPNYLTNRLNSARIDTKSLIISLRYILTLIFFKFYNYDNIINLYMSNNEGKFIIKIILESIVNMSVHGLNPMYTLINRLLSMDILSACEYCNIGDTFDLMYYLPVFVYKDTLGDNITANYLNKPVTVIYNTYYENYNDITGDTPIISDVYMDSLSPFKYYNDLKKLYVVFQPIHYSMISPTAANDDDTTHKKFKITDDVYEMFNRINNKLSEIKSDFVDGFIIENGDSLAYIDIKNRNVYKVVSPFDDNNLKIKIDCEDYVSKFDIYTYLSEYIDKNYYYDGLDFISYRVQDMEEREKTRKFIYKDNETNCSYVVKKQFISYDESLFNNRCDFDADPITTGINRIFKFEHIISYPLCAFGDINNKVNYIYGGGPLADSELTLVNIQSYNFDHSTLPYTHSLTTYIEGDDIDDIEIISPVIESRRNNSNSITTDLDIKPYKYDTYTSRQHIRNTSIFVSNGLALYNGFITTALTSNLIRSYDVRLEHFIGTIRNYIQDNVFYKMNLVTTEVIEFVLNNINSKYGKNFRLTEDVILDIMDLIISYVTEVDNSGDMIVKDDYNVFDILQNLMTTDSSEYSESISSLIIKAIIPWLMRDKSTPHISSVNDQHDIINGGVSAHPLSILSLLYTMIYSKYSEQFVNNYSLLKLPSINKAILIAMLQINIIRTISLFKYIDTNKSKVIYNKETIDSLNKYMCEILQENNIHIFDIAHNSSKIDNIIKLDLPNKLIMKTPIVNVGVLRTIGKVLMSALDSHTNPILSISSCKYISDYIIRIAYNNNDHSRYISNFIPEKFMRNDNSKLIPTIMKDYLLEITILSLFMDVINTIEHNNHIMTTINNIDEYSENILYYKQLLEENIKNV